MANTYKWSIKQLDYIVEQDSKQNVVNNIHWTLVATSDQIARSVEVDGQTVNFFYEALTYGACPIKLADNAYFTRYEQLTEEQILEWLMEALTESQVDAIKKSLDSQIDALVKPTVKSGLPWSN
jgi:type II secretory pathway component PulL